MVINFVNFFSVGASRSVFVCVFVGQDDGGHDESPCRRATWAWHGPLSIQLLCHALL